jgi:hypothetical protein
LIGKNPALVAPSFFTTSTLLSQDSMLEEKQSPKNNSSKKKQLSTKKVGLHRDTLSYSSLSSFDEGDVSTTKQQQNDDQYRDLSQTERLRWRLRKHFENCFLVFIQTEDQRVNPIDANTFLRINDNKVADVIIYEVISMLSDKLTDYHKSMLSLQTQSTEQKDMTVTVKIEIKQEDQDMKEQQLLVQLQRDVFELADLLNLLLIQESCARSIITTIEAKGSTPGSANTSPSRRRQQFDHFCLLKSLELRTVQTFFVLLTSLIEELSQETKLLLGDGRSKNNNVSYTTINGIQAPISYYSQMVGEKMELLEYSRLPLLSNGLGMILPTLAHLNIDKIRKTTKTRDRSDSFDAGVIVIEDDSGGAVDDSVEDVETAPSFSLRQTLLTIAKFLVMNNTLKSGSFKLIQSPKSPVKSSATSHKKVTGLINRLKSLRQQLTSLSTNIIKFNPPLVSVCTDLYFPDTITQVFFS